MQIQVRVFLGMSALNDNNRIFERIIDIHDDVIPPMESLYRDLKFLFGSSSIIQFNLQ